AKDRNSTTLAKIASASKSGSFGIANLETMSFDSFYLYTNWASVSSPQQSSNPRSKGVIR
ncbi:MAG: hypothetical protein J0H75_10275, partial [Rhizobiales bacterium]|nr:hypothetical protein [Hyphomicrobiales bacterium]